MAPLCRMDTILRLHQHCTHTEGGHTAQHCKDCSHIGSSSPKSCRQSGQKKLLEGHSTLYMPFDTLSACMSAGHPWSPSCPWTHLQVQARQKGLADSWQKDSTLSLRATTSFPGHRPSGWTSPAAVHMVTQAGSTVCVQLVRTALQAGTPKMLLQALSLVSCCVLVKANFSLDAVECACLHSMEGISHGLHDALNQ